MSAPFLNLYWQITCAGAIGHGAVIGDVTTIGTDGRPPIGVRSWAGRLPTSPYPNGSGTYAPVFLLAPARSHSSVVTTAIGQHPQLNAFPELGLFRRPTVKALLTDPPAGQGIPALARLGGLMRAVAEHEFGEQSPEAILEAYHWLRRHRRWTGRTCTTICSVVSAPGSVWRRPPTTRRTTGTSAGWRRPIPRPVYPPHPPPGAGDQVDARGVVKAAVVGSTSRVVTSSHGGLAVSS